MPISINTKKAASAVAAAGAILGASMIFGAGQVEICPQKGECREYSNEAYAELKSDIAGKMEAGSEFTVSEWQTAAAVLDREIRAKGSVVLPDVLSGGDLIKKMAGLLSGK